MECQRAARLRIDLEIHCKEYEMRVVNVDCEENA
jgi:hypothetical protein